MLMVKGESDAEREIYGAYRELYLGHQVMLWWTKIRIML
jgi:hypothetical protein